MFKKIEKVFKSNTGCSKKFKNVSRCIKKAPNRDTYFFLSLHFSWETPTISNLLFQIFLEFSDGGSKMVNFHVTSFVDDYKFHGYYMWNSDNFQAPNIGNSKNPTVLRLDLLNGNLFDFILGNMFLYLQLKIDRLVGILFGKVR